MLIRLTIENWRSFREKTTLSMIAGRERQHNERLSAIPKYRLKLSPIAAIYGANASGKTKFIEALLFAKKLIVEGIPVRDAKINVKPYLLSAESERQPTSFVFEILVEETCYEYTFSVTSKAVTEEKLTKVTSSGETVLFERNGNKLSGACATEMEAIEKYGRSTQLFLTTSIELNFEVFRDVYNWFKDQLVIISPNTKPPIPLILKNKKLNDDINDVLQQLDTGIVRLDSAETLITDENLKKLPKPLQRVLLAELQKTDGEMDENAKLTFTEMSAIHSRDDGSEVAFRMSDESDGTRRLIELLPAFLDLGSTKSDKVYFIDELDRSLHTNLTRELLSAYLENCSKTTRSQLVFTTHDVQLMDQSLLRRDEIWIVDRENNGTSTLYSFSDFKEIRKDKDIQKSYLIGRMGGIPRIAPFLKFPIDTFTNPEE